jgi:hypothetical protein
MNHFKKEAKKKNVPVVCAKRGTGSIVCALDRLGFENGKIAANKAPVPQSECDKRCRQALQR